MFESRSVPVVAESVVATRKDQPPLVRAVAPFLASLLRAPRLASCRIGRRDWTFLLAMYVLTRALVIFLGLIAAAMFPYLSPSGRFTLQPPETAGLNLWQRLFTHFDSSWYLIIAGHGYPTPSGGNPQWLLYWAYFPLYPLIVHLLTIALGTLGVGGDANIIAGVLASHAALLAALVYVYRLAAAELSPTVARRTVTYLLVFPAAIFYSAVYTESLFLLVSVAAFYHARRHQWALAGIFASLALLTRAQGLLLLAPLALELASDVGARRRTRSTVLRGQARAMALIRRVFEWRLYRAAWLGLPLLALGGYAIFSRVETGYWFAFSTSATRYWGKRLTPPVYPLLRYVLAPELGGAYNFDFRSVNFATALVFLVLVVVAWRRLPPSYSLWLLLCIGFPLSTNGHYFFSFARYVAIAFPAFIALAAWSLGQRWTPQGTANDTPGRFSLALELRDRLVLIPSLLLLAVYTLMFVNGTFAAI